MFRSISRNYFQPDKSQKVGLNRWCWQGKRLHGKRLEAYAKNHWPKAVIEGVLLTRYGHKSPTSTIQIVEAGHPVPDQAGMDGAKDILALAKQLQPNDVLIALISGGGSSLLTLPVEGISIEGMRKTTEALLRSGHRLKK
nr:DUF4147 domain-containing protein [Polynucleobacter necessarius]